MQCRKHGFIMSAGKTIGIIIARMASNRLPGKVLRLVNGKPLLSYLLESLKATAGLDEIWLATTQHPSDEKLMVWGIQNDLRVLSYPGEMDDVIGRITAVLNKSEAQQFIAIPGDHPFVDASQLSQMLKALDANPEWEGVSVEPPPGGYPLHHAVLCYRTDTWRKLDKAVQQPARTQVVAWAKNHSEPANLGSIAEVDYATQCPHMLEIASQADLNRFEKIVAALAQSDTPLLLSAIVHYANQHPDLFEIQGSARQILQSSQPLRILMAVQAGEEFGTGHLARCKTLAMVLKDHFSAQTTFWLDSTGSSLQQSLIREDYQVMDGSWSLPEVIRQGIYDRLVLDIQTPVTPSLIQSIRYINPDLPIIVMDNNSLGSAEADAVIFPNVHAKPNPDWQLPPNMLYMGSSYVVLGSGFLYDPHDKAISEPLSCPSVLITMGGADPELMTEKVLMALKDLKDCHIDLTVPPLYPHPENLEKIATRLPSTITIHWRIASLKPFMQRATLAVAAFGVTAYELAYMGVPTFLLAHYPAQVEDMERFLQYGSAISLGWAKDVVLDNLLNDVTDLLSNPERRQQIGEKGKQLADAKGPLRVAEAIVATSRKPVASYNY